MEKIIDGKKKCSQCKELKDVSCFGANNQVKSGLSPNCKQCFNERYRLYRNSRKISLDKYNAEYRNKNRSHINAYFRKYKQDRNPNFGQPVVMIRDEKGKFKNKA